MAPVFHTASPCDKMCMDIAHSHLFSQNKWVQGLPIIQMLSFYEIIFWGVWKHPLEKMLHLTLKRRLPFTQGNEVQFLLQTLRLVLQPQRVMTPHWMREDNRLSILEASRLRSVCPWGSPGIPAWTCGFPSVGASSLWASIARFWFLNIHFSHRMDKQANKQKKYIFLL